MLLLVILKIVEHIFVAAKKHLATVANTFQHLLQMLLLSLILSLFFFPFR